MVGLAVCASRDACQAVPRRSDASFEPGNIEQRMVWTRTRKASYVRVSTTFRLLSYSRRVQTYYLLSSGDLISSARQVRTRRFLQCGFTTVIYLSLFIWCWLFLRLCWGGRLNYAIDDHSRSRERSILSRASAHRRIASLKNSGHFVEISTCNDFSGDW